MDTRLENSPGHGSGKQRLVNVLSRSAGVQLHITSLPGGHLGAEAFKFVDWLAQAGQSWWQVLPVSPPDRYRSPYKAQSAFAAWRGLIAEPRAPVTAAEILDFRDRHGFWIDDWERFAGRDAIADQVRFDREWRALRAYAAERGVRLYGDVAIYVSPGSADHVSHPEIFRDGVQAGAPPDAYSASGQLWGNPLYDWPALQRRGYRWWVERLRRTLDLFDLARLDHFRGFVAYWEVPSQARSAAEGRWRRGPGRALFDAFERTLPHGGGGSLPLVAEDLGVITPAVVRLRTAFGYPGMIVIQFGFDPDDPDGPHRFENHTRDKVVYTGTHDTDTARGWYESLPGVRRSAVDAVARAHEIRERQSWWRVILLAHLSPAPIAMVQAQDVLGLGSQARMNVPGRAGGSWRWQMEPGALTDALARRLRDLTEAAGRLAA